MSQRTLTPELRNLICSFIRAGGYPHVAAEAAGVPLPLFMRWMKRGRRPRAVGEHRLLYEAVLAAQATSRLTAESHVHQADPLAWLKFGQGRDSPERPGWSNAAKPVAHDARNATSRDETQSLVRTLLRLLEPFPEARVSVSEALLKRKAKKRHAKTTQTMDPVEAGTEPVPESPFVPETRTADPASDDRALPGVSS